MSADAVFVHPPGAARYKFRADHPFDPIRLTLAIDLLTSVGALKASDIIASEPADTNLLSLVHRPDYIHAVTALSKEHPETRWLDEAERFGLGTEDTPFFPGMHDAAAQLVGGSVRAAEEVMSGRALHAYHMAGGLHHAFPERGAGFCVYNDAAIAIKYIRQRYGAKVLYIDTDVHHGDGVQWAFYDDADVCTYSIHETGKYLFPGTGFVHERGSELGFGFCYNMPVEPYTEDDSWLESFVSTVEKVARAFRPDIIVSQHGCDAHALDPLSHIHCSTRIYLEMPRIIHELAHRYAQGRWVAVGGGGYDIWRVVPRAWSLVWLAMTEHPLVGRLVAGENAPLPAEWVARWLPHSPEPLPDRWLDDTSAWTPMPRRAEITAKNQATAGILVQDL
ncbi:acetoin utilization protein AcuC [Paenibacillus cisolokensis]|uniref:Acetoin utilization protein AcuC n=1 Tax=Paenibacillus cisolokensis TaxID=1658519 RepID=A0ABQ4N003_9BACL|nr:acetoin utilization protein AcuC [Paenibacillus cisolokensis]GIQ61470.1 acetoin utilization protein AcuC [Paenibacillus cisolokensis]